MKISEAERIAIQGALAYGEAVGYGNLISHLQTAWAARLMRDYDMPEEAARREAGGPGYPFLMQRDIVERGEWDETGARYRKATPMPKSKPKKKR